MKCHYQLGSMCSSLCDDKQQHCDACWWSSSPRQPFVGRLRSNKVGTIDCTALRVVGCMCYSLDPFLHTKYTRIIRRMIFVRT